MLIAVVPAFNEEQRIGSVVQDLFQHVDKVVVVDDGSNDKTYERAEALGAVVLRHKINRGQGAALETGHDYARLINADYVLHFDGDGQFDVNDIGPALQKIKDEEADVLLGSRFLGKDSNIPWFKRYVLIPIARVCESILGGLRLSDVHNGFRVLNKKALNKIKITQDRMAHATEITAQIKKHNLRYVEYPVKVVYHEYGQGISGGIRVIKDLLFNRFLK